MNNQQINKIYKKLKQFFLGSIYKILASAIRIKVLNIDMIKKPILFLLYIDCSFSHFYLIIEIIKNSYKKGIKKMASKFTKQYSGLVLDSKIQADYLQGIPSSIKSPKASTPSPHNFRVVSPIHRKSSQPQIYQKILSSDQSFSTNSLPVSLKRLCSLDSCATKASNQLEKLQQQKEMLQRNFLHEVEFYIRLRMKDLVTIQELLLNNQIQRLRAYVETELALLKKRHEDFLGEDSYCKPTLTRDTFIKSTLEQDMAFKSLINNMITNLEHSQKTSNQLSNAIKKLNSQSQLNSKKLATYFQQAPFEVKSPQASNILASKFINQLGYTDGHQILQQISKSISQISKGKYTLQLEQPIPKSQMSKLIEEHSLNKIKSKRSC